MSIPEAPKRYIGPVLVMTCAWIIAGVVLSQSRVAVGQATPPQDPSATQPSSAPVIQPATAPASRPVVPPAPVRTITPGGAARPTGAPATQPAPRPFVPPVVPPAEPSESSATPEATPAEADGAQPMENESAADGNAEDAPDGEAAPAAAQDAPTTGPTTAPAATQSTGPTTQPVVEPGATPVRPGERPNRRGVDRSRTRTPEELAELRARTEAARNRARGITPERPAGTPDGEQPADPATIEGADEPMQDPDAPQTAPVTRPGRRGVTRPGQDPPPPATPEPEVEDEPETPVVAAPPAADGKTEWFNFEATPWEEVIALMAKWIGKPLMATDVFVPGDLTYKTTRRFTRQEALDELNFLLVEQGYFLADTENYVYLVPLTEAQKLLDLSHFYPSLEAFKAANRRDYELVSVIIKIEEQVAEQIRDMLSPSMPDYALPVVVGDTNAIKITGLARDVRRFEGLLGIVKTESFDPRVTKFFEIKTNVRTIETMVREMLELGSRQMRYNPQTRRMEAVAQEGNEIRILADERTKTLIVKATPDELNEVAELIEKIDSAKDIGEFGTTVLPVINGDASEIADLINEIFQQERGASRPVIRTPVRTTNTRTRTPQPQQQPGQPATPQDVIEEDIYEQARKTVRLVADPRTNTLVVYANAEGLARVKELLDTIDRPVPSNFQTIKLKFADADQIQPIVQEIANSMAATSPGRGRSRGPNVIADIANNALHIIAERTEMPMIETTIRDLDVEGQEQQRYVVELVHVLPSTMAPVVENLLGSDAASGRSTRIARRPGGRQGPTTSIGSNVIALDQARLLIVYCTEEQWEKVEETIRIWDEGAVSSNPIVKLYDIANGDLNSIAETLGRMFAQFEDPMFGRTTPIIQVQGEQLLVYAVRPAIDEIEALLPQLDVPVTENPLVVWPLMHAEAEQVAEIAQGLLPQSGGGGRGFRRGGGPPAPSADASVIPEPVTNSLIIKADRLTTERVIAFAKEQDERVAAIAPVRRFYTLKHASPQDVVTAIGNIFGAASGGRGFGRNRTAAVGEDIKATVVGSQVLVDAPESKQLEIASLVEQLDALNDLGITTMLVKMPGADVASIARKLDGAFETKVRQQGAVASFDADPVTETILVTVSRDVADEANKLLEQYREEAKGLVNQTEFVQLKNAESGAVAQWLQNELVTLLSKQHGRAAAQQVRVTAEPGTNRVIISAPQVAVTAAKNLLTEYDQPRTVGEPTPPPVETGIVKLPGLDVASIANNLTESFRVQPKRPDGLSRSFGYDRITETVIYTVPKDEVGEVDKLIQKFVAETEGMQPEQRIFDITETDATYVSQQLMQILNVQISGRRGQDVARRVNTTVDTRNNRIIMNAPQFAIEMAESLVAELDKPTTGEGQLRTIPLKTADANTMNNILRTIFAEKLRAKTLQISVDPLTNALIVGGNKEDFEEIRKWAEDIDAQAADEALEQKVFDLINANPWEVNQVLQQMYQPRRSGRVVPPGQEVTTSIIAQRSIFVTAPPEKMREIEGLVEKLDGIGANEAIVRTYKLPGLGADLQNFARQIESAVNANKTQRELRVSITAVPAAETLVVTALEKELGEVEKAMEQFKDLFKPAEIQTIQLTYGDANMVLQALTRVLQTKIRSGQIQIGVEPMLNALIVSANEDDLAGIRKWADEFDTAAKEAAVKPRFFDLQFVDATQIIDTVRAMVQARSGGNKGSRTAGELNITADARTNRLIVSAPEWVYPDVEAVIAQLDVDVPDDAPITVQLKYADPAEVQRTITDMYNRRGGGRSVSGTQEVQVTVANNALVIKAPAKQRESILALIEKIDAEDPGELQIRSYTLKVLNAEKVAQQVQFFLASLQSNVRRGQMKPGAFAEPTTNTLVVLAPADQLPMIETLIKSIELNGLPESEPRSYDLSYVQADTIAKNLEQMLRAKVTEAHAGRQSPIVPTVVGDPATNRLIVFAPDEYHELASSLIKMFDREAQAGQVTRILAVENGDAAALVQTASGMKNVAGRRGLAERVAMSADPGSNSILLAGLERDVAEAEDIIRSLDQTSNAAAVLKIFDLKFASAYNLTSQLLDLFPPGTKPSEDVTVTEDEYYNRLIVTANKRKMRQVEEYIELLDQRPESYSEDGLLDGKVINFVEITRGDAMDIEWAVSDFFPPEEAGGPKIEADWDGEYITVVSRPDEFPKIEALIRKFEARAKPDIVIRERRMKGDMDRYLEYLKLRNPNVVLDIAEEGKKRRPSIVEELWEEGEEPPRPDKDKPAENEDKPKTDPSKVGRAFEPDRDAFRLASFDSAQDPAADEPPARPERPTTDPDLEARITILPDGRIIMKGPRSRLDEVEDTMDLLEEEVGADEVIRIFQFRHGDVNAAARILEMMFNEPAQRVVQQRQQPNQQQPQQGRGGRGNQQGGGEGGEQNKDPQAAMMDQLRSVLGGQQGGQQGGGGGTTGGQKIRIATDASHNYIIVKCDEALLPDIRQLLRELDIPPAEVDVKVFQLRNLDAAETAENVKAVLGISKARSAPQPARGNPQQAQLMEILQQQMVSLGGEAGVAAKIESVEIVPNSVTNSLLVSAPPEVMKIVENVVNQLEELEGRDIVVLRSVELQKAKVSDVLPLLQEIFAGATGGGPRGGRGAANPANLGEVTISGDPRTNTIIYSAETKDTQIIEAQIRELDTEGALAEVETYVCEYGDAQSIAQTVSEIFVQGAGGGGGRGGRGQGGGGSAATDLRVTAEPVTNTILVFGPKDQRELVLAEVTSLDQKSRRDIREIEVKFADPEKLAEQVGSIFGGSVVSAEAAGRAGGRGGIRGGIESTGGRLVVVGSKDAGKLLVRAPDALFAQIQDIVKTLDTPSEMVLVRRYALNFVKAEDVVSAVTGAMMQFVQARSMLGGGGGRGGAGGGDLGIDAFTAIPEPRTNSVLVVGSEQTFKFVESILAVVDVDTPPDQRRVFRLFVLREADALTVAEAINNFAAGSGAQEAVAGPGGGRGGRGGIASLLGTPSLGDAGKLDVFAVAEPATNGVMVFGKLEDIDTIEAAIIKPYEGAVGRSFASIPVKNLSPSEVFSLISPILDSGFGGEGRLVPQVTPNDSAGQLVVYASSTDAERITTLVKQFDVPGNKPNQIKIIPVPYGQDAGSLASVVQAVVNDGERILAETRGIQPRQVTIGASGDNLIVYGDPALYGMVETVVAQVAEGQGAVVTKVIELVNLTSSDAAGYIEELQSQRSGNVSPSSTGGSFRPGGNTGRRTTITPRGSGNTGGRPNFQPGQTPRRPQGGQPRGGDGNRGGGRGGRGASAYTPGVGGEPVHAGWPIVSTLILNPAATLAALFQDPAGAQDPPPPEPARQPETAPQPAGPQLNALTGRLRGNVTTSPIDSKRLLITGNENDVAFIIQMLTMLEQTTEAPSIEVFRIENGTAAALAPILEQVLTAQIEASGASGDRLGRFSIVAEGKSNSIIVSASKSNLDLAAGIIQSLDVPQPGGGAQLKVIALQHIRASEAVANLTTLVEQMNRLKQTPEEARATITGNDRSNTVFVQGTPSDIAEIERMIESIDQELPVENPFNVGHMVVIDLKNARAEDLAEVLNELVTVERAAGAGGQGGATGTAFVRKLILTSSEGTQLPPLDLDKPIKIEAEPAKNSLIISSSEENNEALRAIVTLFDQLPAGDNIDVKSFRLLHAPAEQIATLLQEMFDNARQDVLIRPTDASTRADGAMPAQPPGLAAKGLPYTVTISHDPRSNTVIIVGHEDAVLLAAGLVKELDRPNIELGQQAYVMDLKNLQAPRMKEMLDELLTERLESLGADGNAARDSAVISVDDRSNKLIVLATPEMFEVVSDLAGQLDAAAPHTIVTSELRRLEHADATKLGNMLQEVFDRKKDADGEVMPDGQKNVLFVFSDDRSNSLVLTGTRDYLAEATSFIERLDQVMTPTTEFRVRPVLLGSAATIATLLQEMVDKSRSQQGETAAGSPVYISADSYSNTLLIAASTEDMRSVERWIDLLDRRSEPGRITRIYPLARGDAQEIAQQAAEIFQSTASGAQSDVTVIHDPSSNSIVAVGPPTVIKDIGDFIEKLNSTDPLVPGMVRVFKLEQADAELAADLLLSIIENRSGTVGTTGGGTRSSSGAGSTQEAAQNLMLVYQTQHPEFGQQTLRALREGIRVVGDLRTNSLFVTAPQSAMPLIESLIVAIDIPPDAAKVQVFPLRNGDAEEMVTQLEALFEESTSGGGSTGGAAGDIGQRELTLGDSLGEGGRQALKFAIDKRTNSIIAAGTPGYLKLVADLVLELDSQPIDERKTFVYHPRNNTSEAIQTALSEFSQEKQRIFDELGEEISTARKLEHQILAVNSTDTNRILINYDPRQQSDVLNMVSELDRPPPQVMIQVLIVEVTIDNRFELGVEFAFQDLQFTKAGPTDTTSFDLVGGTDIGAAGAGLGGFTFTITGSDFNFLLRALQNEGRLNVLSRPQIVAMDNELARIEITRQVPFPQNSTTVAGQTNTNITREDVGVRLEVTPHINPDGFVRMEILQEVSDLTSSNVDLGNGLTAPITFKREAETVVTVKDNETVVLGGLITSRDENREQKVPLVGDVPILGQLFRNTTNTTERTELLVVLTPRIVRTVEDYRELSIAERDRTGILPPDVLSSPLMNKLRVAPEDLRPEEPENELLGPFPQNGQTLEPKPRDEDVYGPVRQPARRDNQPAPPKVENSYDIPVSSAKRTPAATGKG